MAGSNKNSKRISSRCKSKIIKKAGARSSESRSRKSKKNRKSNKKQKAVVCNMTGGVCIAPDLKKGGCGCDGAVNLSPISHGGSSTFSVPLKVVYPLNTYENDMTDPKNMISSRNLSGGNASTKKRVRKSRGGSGVTGFFNDPISSVGTILGTNYSNSVLNSTNVTGPYTNSSTTIQPVLLPFNRTNPPLV